MPNFSASVLRRASKRDDLDTEVLSRRQSTRKAGATGSVEALIEALTDRINDLKAYFRAHPTSNHSRRDLLKLVGQRRQLLDYLKRKDEKRYQAIIGKLGIRR